MIRSPAVAGAFYEARPAALERHVRSLLPAGAVAGLRSARSFPTPATSTRGPWRARSMRGSRSRLVVILCPNHTGRGAPAALDPSEAWRTPLGDVAVDRKLAERLRELAPSLEPDAAAHAREHSLEVQLPFLQVLRPDVAIVAVCLGAADLELCREIGEALARLASEGAGEATPPPLLLASSDMNHYESRAVGRRKDDLALARIEAIDPEGLFATVRAHSISMCGFPPGDRAPLRGAAAGRAGGSRRRAARQRRRDRGHEIRRGLRRRDHRGSTPAAPSDPCASRSRPPGGFRPRAHGGPRRRPGARRSRSRVPRSGRRRRSR